MYFINVILNVLGISATEFTAHVKMYGLILIIEKAMKGIQKLWKLARSYFAEKKRVSESLPMPFDVIMLVFVPRKDDLVLAAVVRLQLLR